MANQHEYPFFTNRECQFFPCHDGLDPDDFNCLFCYCPLYALGSECGGDFRINKKGVKDCTGCNRPHAGDAGTKLVKEQFSKLVALTKERMASASDESCEPLTGEGAL